jgi:DNA helicase-2/ATP-dependent DNA helicase PcrA
VQWLRQTGQHALNVDSDSILPEDRAAFTNLRLDVESLGDMALTSSAREVVHSAMERSRHVGVLDLEHPLDQLEAAANVRKFADLVARFDADHPGGDSRAFLSYLDLAAQADSEQADIPREITPIAVRASTVHSAKGLEFAHVFVVNLAEHRFPLESRERLLDVPAVLVEEELAAATSLDEERRLFYVAITRAMDGLTVTYAQRYNTWAREPVSPSQFLEELRRLAGEQLREMTAEQAMLPADAVTRPPRGVAEATSAFSYSQLQTFSDCPRRFSYEFEFHLPQRETRELALGNLTHHALEQAARQRLNGFTPTDQDIRAHIEEAWKAATFDKAAWPELEQVAGEIVLRYMSTTGWSDAQLREVERDFSYDDPPFVFSGRIDRLDLREGRPVIVDYKSGRPRTLEAVQKDFRLGRQFGMYRLGARQLLSTASLDAEVHFIAGGEAIRIDQDEDQLERHRRWAWAVAKSIGEARRTRHYPVNPNDFNCPTCPFRLVCDEGQEFLRAK